MAQAFKSIYFADFPSDEPSRRNLTLAFAPDDQVWDAVANLTSFELRELLGTASYLELRSRASRARLSLNAFCHRQLQDSLATTRTPSNLDPVQATFRGSADDPMQRWFPFLEAYSPGFVSYVLSEYAPQATTVYDPFAGIGTTPLTVARQGLVALYSEVNPLMQAVTQAKADVLTLSARRSALVARELTDTTLAVLSGPDQFEPDAQLQAAFRGTFGEVDYFDEDTMADVLRLRSWCDDTRSTLDPVSTRLAELAIVASLVRASRLIRAGDLRYRKPSDRGDPRPIRMLVAEKLEQIVEDLPRLRNGPLVPPITLVSEDVRDLARIPALGFDAVVTSPPYLNGTNYFRNTKLELWFLRRLRGADDLRGFRSRSIVAGINDVAGPSIREIPRAALELVSALEKAAYDRRIPRMVGAYFADMQSVFGQVARHARPGTTVAIDIGDSVYAGVRVPTDQVMIDLMAESNFRVVDQVVLRRRLSRDGSELRQALLVFRGRADRVAPIAARRPPLGWSQFRALLPHKAGAMAKRNWGHPLHSLCSYQGKMKPSLAASLVMAIVKPGDKVLDPFCGVGTIPFEAASIGALSFGFEISPAALAISRAKLNPPTSAEVEDALVELEGFMSEYRVSDPERAEGRSFGLNGPIADYFHASTLDDVLAARVFFNTRELTSGTNFIRACTLHVLHGNRPYALSRRSHPITPFAPSGPFVHRSVLESVRAKARRSLAELPSQFLPGVAVDQDATSAWGDVVGELDAVVTSPPFFDSTRFHTGNWLRLWFAGWSPEDFRKMPPRFVDERQKQSFDVYKPILRQSREHLREGGLLLLHLGLSAKSGMATELERVARPWFRRIDRFSEDVGTLEGHGISDRGGTQAHQYLLLG